MNTGNYTIRLLFIIFLASVAQKTNAQESELNETMRRWLREQNERTIEPDFRLPQQPQQFPQIQHQQRQQEVLRVSPTTRLPTYLDRLQISDSTELILLRNMFDNLGRLDFNVIFIDGIYNPPLRPQNVAHQICTSGGGGISLPCPDIRRAERQRARLRGMGIEPLPTRLEIREIYEIIERANQIFREARDNEEGLD